MDNPSPEPGGTPPTDSESPIPPPDAQARQLIAATSSLFPRLELKSLALSRPDLAGDYDASVKAFEDAMAAAARAKAAGDDAGEHPF